MQATFHIERERSNELIYQEFENDSGLFHFHTQIELYFVDEGEMEVFINSHRRRLQPGDMAVSLSYDAHVYRTISHSRSSLLIIPPHLCGNFMESIRHKRVKNPFICSAGAVQEIKSCVNAIRNGDLNEIKLQGYIYVILGIVLDNLCLEDADASIDNALSSRLLFYLNRNYKQEITLASLSSAFGYSQTYLSRYFKSCFGVGITQYVNILRLRNALMLMQKKQNSHTYCALESGFSSVRTFYRVFQNEFHCAPRDFFLSLEHATKP